MDWILQRAKAFAAALAVAIVMAVIKTFEDNFGVPVPAGISSILLDFVNGVFSPDTIVTALATGVAVERIPNKAA